MEGEFSLKRILGHRCPEINQLHIPLNTHVIRNAVWTHFETFSCHAEDEYVSSTQHGIDDEDSAPVLACQFSKDGLGGHLLATGDEQGQVVLMDTRRRAKQSVIEEFTAHHNAIHEVCWNRNSSELITASADNTLKLWDVNCLCKELSTLQGHQASIKSVDAHREEPTILVSGGRDGLVAVWDTRYNNRGTHHSPLCVTHSCSPRCIGRSRFREYVATKSSTRQSVTAVHFLGNNGILSSGVDGTIKVWDKRSLHDAWHVFKTPKTLGISAITVDASHTQMFASCKDSKIYAFDCMRFQSTTPVAQYSGHTVSSYYVKIALSPDDKYLLSGSANTGPFDSGGFIWEVNNREEEDFARSPLVMLPGQSGEVTGVAWCPSQLSKVVTCSDNHDTWIWRTSNDNSDKIIGHSEQGTVRGYLRVRTPRVSPTPSPSNHSRQSTATEEGKVAVKNKDQASDTISNKGIEQTMDSGLTTPVTSPSVKHPSSTSSSSGRKRRIPLDCITNSNGGSLTPTRMVPVKRTKQTTLEILLTKPKSK